MLMLATPIETEADAWTEYMRTRSGHAKAKLMASLLYLLEQVAGRMKRRLADSIEVEDLVQAGSFGLAKAIEKVEHVEGSFPAYATTCIKNAIYDWLRYEARCTGRGRVRVTSLNAPRGHHDDAGSLLDDVASAGGGRGFELIDRRDLFDDQLRSLPEHQRRIMRLHYRDGQTFDQIAVALGIDGNAALREHDKALKTLRAFAVQEEAKMETTFAEPTGETLTDLTTTGNGEPSAARPPLNPVDRFEAIVRDAVDHLAELDDAITKVREDLERAMLIRPRVANEEMQLVDYLIDQGIRHLVAVRRSTAVRARPANPVETPKPVLAQPTRTLETLLSIYDHDEKEDMIDRWLVGGKKLMEATGADLDREIAKHERRRFEHGKTITFYREVRNNVDDDEKVGARLRRDELKAILRRHKL
ncbi:MAG TPA: sigma-70 family RNA polymerase sigma factor [Tepidisphaeraceae bacterium]|jgi:RNA polymerase sigma factor (sigma-70 family)|nr:sigma-70 family RNA polymerase sigma factor [Tepidisphaeraceae bacterium]